MATMRSAPLETRKIAIDAGPFFCELVITWGRDGKGMRIEEEEEEEEKDEKENGGKIEGGRGREGEEEKDEKMEEK